MIKRAGIYTRISLDRSDEATGVARQEAECRELAAQLGFEVVEVYCDNNKSAMNQRVVRTEFERMLTDAQAGLFDALLVWHTDRLYRRVTELDRIISGLEATKIEIRTVKAGDIDLATASGRTIARILGSIAQGESERTAERIKARAEQRRLVEGRQTASKRPFGWRWIEPDPQNPNRPLSGSRAGLELDPKESKIVKKVYQRFIGGDNLTVLSKWLNAEGIKGTQGGQWRQSRVSALLRSGRHAGLITNIDRTGNVISVVGDSADGRRIVSREVWEQAQFILKDPARKMKPGRPPVSLLGALKNIYCEVCGGPVVAGSNSNKKARYLTYQCKEHNHVSRKREVVEAEVVEAVARFLTNNAQFLRGVATAQPKSDELAEVRRLQTDLEALGKQLANGEITASIYGLAATAIQEKLDRLDAPRTLSPILKAVAESDDVADRFRQLAVENPSGARDVISATCVAIWIQPRRAKTEIVTLPLAIDMTAEEFKRLPETLRESDLPEFLPKNLSRRVVAAMARD